MVCYPRRGATTSCRNRLLLVLDSRYVASSLVCFGCLFLCVVLLLLLLLLLVVVGLAVVACRRRRCCLFYL